MYTQSIGLVGGFGAYATLNFYKRILESFSGDSERDIPHIYMDCDFTMPSRTRALLYDEEYDLVVKQISDSVSKLINFGSDYIIFVCGTAHYFLDDIYQIVPQCRQKVINIIEVLGKQLVSNGVNEVLVIAAEGALMKGVYENKLHNINCVTPSEENYKEIRFFIEAVKSNNITPLTIDRYIDFLYRFNQKNIILGCTEFPILTETARKYSPDALVDFVFYDPLEATVQYLKNVLY